METVATAAYETAYSKPIFAGRTFRGAPVSELDPFTTEIFDDPRVFHDALLNAGPLVWLERHGCWAAARYEIVRSILSDWKTFCSSRGVGLDDFGKVKPIRKQSEILEADPPDHTPLRQVINRVISPVAIKRLTARWTEIAEELVECCLQKGSFDAVTNLAEEFPLTVMPEAIGLKLSRDYLLPYGSFVFTIFGPDNELRRQAFSQAPALLKWLDQQVRRENLTSTGFGAEFYAAADRGEITEYQALVAVRALLGAGLDTTVNTISAAIEALASFPDQWAKLRAQPSLARATFEETLRFDSPLQIFFRTTSRSVTIGEVELQEGEKVAIFFGAANHDPRRWTDPYKFDIERKTAGHVGFGHGIHTCAGQFVARLEGEVLLEVLARRVSSIQVTGPKTIRYNNVLHGAASLPVTMERA